MGDRLERELKLKEEIRRRLSSICSNLSPRDFDELIEKIAANQLKGEYRPFRPGSISRLDVRTSAGPKPPPEPRKSL
ncbi:MAG: hypothetical protein ACM3ND_04380 [Acidobacteriota bacterium]